MSKVLRDRVIVTVAAIVWIAGTLLGLGVVGGSAGVASQGEGLFSDHATLIAPHGPAFSIWTAIYVGLGAYAVWQWLPATSRSPYAALTRVPAAASMALNGVWLVVVWAGWLTASVVVMGLIAVSLGILLRRLAGLRDEGRVANVVVTLTFGLYLGWICVATCANVATWAVALGVPAADTGSVWTTVGVLAVVVCLTIFLIHRSDRPFFRAGITLAVVWGASWIAVARLTGELLSPVVGCAALIAAVVVAAVGGWMTDRARRDMT